MAPLNWERGDGTHGTRDTRDSGHAGLGPQQPSPQGELLGAIASAGAFSATALVRVPFPSMEGLCTPRARNKRPPELPFPRPLRAVGPWSFSPLPC